MVIIVTSDKHLGYTNSNSGDFLEFLTEISKRKDITDFVILGDFIDMWTSLNCIFKFVERRFFEFNFKGAIWFGSCLTNILIGCKMMIKGFYL